MPTRAGAQGAECQGARGTESLAAAAVGSEPLGQLPWLPLCPSSPSLPAEDALSPGAAACPVPTLTALFLSFSGFHSLELLDFWLLHA